MSKHVALIQGGMSAEQDVSRVTGAAFAKALDQLGITYDVLEADHSLLSNLTAKKYDVALLAVHGKFAEDGIVQAICEFLKIPYSGTGILSSSICMDKKFTKELFSYHKIPTPKYQSFDFSKTPVTAAKVEIPLPVVVKPSREGSSVGVTIVKDQETLMPALREARQYDHYVIVEEFIDGKELTVPYFLGKTLTSIEIVPKQEFYNYENKYTAGKTDYHLPARVTEDCKRKCAELTLKAAEVLRVRTYARIDFMVDVNEEPYVIEVNTLPGFTPTSLVPKAALHDGIEFKELIHSLINNAGLDYEGLR